MEYTNDKQRCGIGKRMKPALPIELKKINHNLDWSTDHVLPSGLVLNEHTGTISGRPKAHAQLGPFKTTVHAESQKMKYSGAFGITITATPIERVSYPNGNIISLVRGEKIQAPVCPDAEGSYPMKFSIEPCPPFEVTKLNKKEDEKTAEDPAETQVTQVTETEDVGKTAGPLSALGIEFDGATGGFSGCPCTLGKTSWKVTAANTVSSKTSDVVVIFVRRGKDETDPPKEHFSIPQENFQPLTLSEAIEVFGGTESGRFVRQQVGNILRACGKTPTPKEVRDIFAMYAADKPYVTEEQLQAIVEYDKFYTLEVGNIEKIFHDLDPEATGYIAVKTFRRMLKDGVGVPDAIITDILHSVQTRVKGKMLNYKELLDLYSRISYGVSYDHKKPGYHKMVKEKARIMVEEAEAARREQEEKEEMEKIVEDAKAEVERKKKEKKKKEKKEKKKGKEKKHKSHHSHDGESDGDKSEKKKKHKSKHDKDKKHKDKSEDKEKDKKDKHKDKKKEDKDKKEEKKKSKDEGKKEKSSGDKSKEDKSKDGESEMYELDDDVV